MIEDPKFGGRRCLEGGLERCLDRLHVVWARTDHDEVKVAPVIRTYSYYRVSIFLNVRTDICWCALHFRQRISWCNSCPCCGGAVECMCQLLLGQLRTAGRGQTPEVLKAGSLASRESFQLQSLDAGGTNSQGRDPHTGWPWRSSTVSWRHPHKISPACTQLSL